MRAFMQRIALDILATLLNHMKSSALYNEAFSEENQAMVWNLLLLMRNFLKTCPFWHP